MGNIAAIRARALAALIPPPRLHLSQWIEANIRLPEGTSALPGRVRLWPYQREIADAIKTILRSSEVAGEATPTPARVAYIARRDMRAGTGDSACGEQRQVN